MKNIIDTLLALCKEKWIYSNLAKFKVLGTVEHGEFLPGACKTAHLGLALRGQTFVPGPGLSGTTLLQQFFTPNLCHSRLCSICSRRA